MSPTPIPYKEWAPVPGLTVLSRSEGIEFANRLPVTPYFVITYSGLHQGIDRAFIAGSRHDPEAVIVQHGGSLTELEYFGRDPEAGWKLLSRIPDWDCVNGSTEDMTRFAEILTREVRLPFHWNGDLYYTLESRPHPYSDPTVRLLGVDDIPLFPRTDATHWAGGFATYEELLTQGVVAASVVDGQMVAIAVCGAANPRYADIGVQTLEPHRRRGLSSAAVYLVAREIQARGLVPIWSTGSHNLASQRVATKVGFVPYGQGAYLIVDGLRERGGYRPA